MREDLAGFLVPENETVLVAKVIRTSEGLYTACLISKRTEEAAALFTLSTAMSTFADEHLGPQQPESPPPEVLH